MAGFSKIEDHSASRDALYTGGKTGKKGFVIEFSRLREVDLQQRYTQ